MAMRPDDPSLRVGDEVAMGDDGLLTAAPHGGSPAGGSRSREGPQPGYGESENTDTHLWPIVSETPYAPSLRITAEGALSINVGSLVIVKPIEEWHALALADLDARTAELRSRLQPAPGASAAAAERVNKTLADANDLLASISAALAEQEEENERLREALKPFAEAAEELDGEIDEQLYDDDYVKSCRDSDLDIPLDCQHHIVITERLRRKISAAARVALRSRIEGG